MMSSRLLSSQLANSALVPDFFTERDTLPRLALMTTPSIGVISRGPLDTFVPRLLASLISASNRSSDVDEVLVLASNLSAIFSVSFRSRNSSAKSVHLGRPDLGAEPITSPTLDGTFCVTFVRCEWPDGERFKTWRTVALSCPAAWIASAKRALS